MRRTSRPAGESREGAALFGSASRQGGRPVPQQRIRDRRPYEMRLQALRRESPERAEPSLVGAWGYPPTPIRSASRQGGKPVPQQRIRDRRPYEMRLQAVRRESPERAEPSLVGVWGYPPTPIRSASRQGSGRTLQSLIDEALEPFSQATGVSSSVPSDDARGFPEVGLAHPEILRSPSEGRPKNLRPLPSQRSQTPTAVLDSSPEHSEFRAQDSPCHSNNGSDEESGSGSASSCGLPYIAIPAEAGIHFC